MGKDPDYLPALRFERLTPLYDPLMRRVFREEAFRRRLIGQAGIRPGMRAGPGLRYRNPGPPDPAVPAASSGGRLDGDRRVLEDRTG
jgi:hypothetical protein